MPLDPFFAERMPLLEGIPDYATAFSNPELTSRIERFAQRPFTWEVPTSIEWTSQTIEGRHGPFEVRIYRPRKPAGAGLLWLHGGGWAHGTLEMVEAHVAAAELADRTTAVVVSVGYHLASDMLKYPAPLDDVVSAWEWLISARPDLNIGGSIAIGGASAGASLALAGAMRVRDDGGTAPSHMLLAYPVVHFPVPAMSSANAAAMHALPPLVRFEPDRVAEMQSYYVGRLTNLPVYSTPGHGNFVGLPRTLVLVAEYDDLRPSGELLARQLRESGVEVELRLALGMLHGHLNYEPGGDLPEVSASLDFFARFARTG